MMFVRSCLVSEALAVTLRMRTAYNVTWQMRQNAVLSVFLPGFLLVPDVTHAHVPTTGHQLTHPTRVRVKDPEINRVKGIVSRDEYFF
jgi:hypothetical protein